MSLIEKCYCSKCNMPIKENDPTVIDEGSLYHFKCFFPKGVPDEVNIVGAGVVAKIQK